MTATETAVLAQPPAKVGASAMAAVAAAADGGSAPAGGATATMNTTSVVESAVPGSFCAGLWQEVAAPGGIFR